MHSLCPTDRANKLTASLFVSWPVWLRPEHRSAPQYQVVGVTIATLWEVIYNITHMVCDINFLTGVYRRSPRTSTSCSWVLSTERTILSPFTKEYRALGTPTGIPFFLECPSRGPTNSNPNLEIRRGVEFCAPEVILRISSTLIKPCWVRIGLGNCGMIASTLLKPRSGDLMLNATAAQWDELQCSSRNQGSFTSSPAMWAERVVQCKWTRSVRDLETTLQWQASDHRALIEIISNALASISSHCSFTAASQ